MNKSESIKNISKALSDFQSEIKNPANSTNNPFFKSKYAPLNEILNLVRPILAKHELSVLQSPAGNGSDISITTLLMHSSGEWVETEPLILKADKITAQGAGSAITYGRRYSLSAVLGFSSEDDDDGNSLEHGKETKKPSELQLKIEALANLLKATPELMTQIKEKCNDNENKILATLEAIKKQKEQKAEVKS